MQSIFALSNQYLKRQWSIHYCNKIFCCSIHHSKRNYRRRSQYLRHSLSSRRSHKKSRTVKISKLQNQMKQVNEYLNNEINGIWNLLPLINVSTQKQLIQAVLKLQNHSNMSQQSHTIQPNFKTLQLIALRSMIPFIGFGFVDNFVLILAGDYIDLTIGIKFGISTIAAAGIGNIISDIAGIGLGGIIEDISSRLGLPHPNLTPAQSRLSITKWAHYGGCSLGILIGCTLGMIPLCFIETRDIHKNERQED